MAGELILIVEDNERNRKLARDVLQFRGYRTLEAETGGDALTLAIEHRPDLILMDIQLPDMDGVQALGLLRSEASARSVRVIALTAFAMAQDRDRLLAAGFDGYISKPIDVKAFPEQVRQYCELSPRRP
jgi:two-component system cell cycle response regulator DivK